MKKIQSKPSQEFSTSDLVLEGRNAACSYTGIQNSKSKKKSVLSSYLGIVGLSSSMQETKRNFAPVFSLNA